MKLSVSSIEYILENDTPVVLLFCRDLEGNRFILRDSYRPYFYVSEETYRQASELHSLDSEPVDLPTYTLSSRLRKLYVKKPRDVALYRSLKVSSRLIETFEADVLFPDRYRIDKGIYTGVEWDPVSNKIQPADVPSVLRKVYIDIEVLSSRAPDPVNTPDEVISVTLYDNFRDLYTVITVSQEQYDLSEALTKSGRIHMIRASNEKSLLLLLLQYLEEFQPDLLLGFGNFDWLYIFNRSVKLKLPYKMASPVGVVQLQGDRIKVHGLEYINLQDLYSVVYLSRSKWETLEEISSRELGLFRLYSKIDVRETWNTDRRKVLLRNVRDVDLIRRLDEDLGLTLFLDSIRHIVGTNFSNLLYKNRIADILYLRHSHNKVILPTKKARRKTPYQGAFILPVEPNVYDGIAVLDWNEMYPSIILSFNISYETYRRNPSQDCYNIDGLFSYVKSPKGITPTLIEELRNLRIPWKERSKDPSLSPEERLRAGIISSAYKAVINSLYGLWAYAGQREKEIPASRLYFPEVASSVAYLGRVLIQEAISYCSQRFRVVYADTDSLFIQVPRDSVQSLLTEITSHIRNYLSSKYGVESKLSLSLDKYFQRLILLTKKRYVGLCENGEVEVKGLEAVRRETADISSNAQRLVWESIFRGESKEEILNKLNKLSEDVKHLPLQQVSKTLKLSKPLSSYKVLSENVKAFLYSKNFLGLQLDEDKRFYVTPVRGLPTPYPLELHLASGDGKTRKIKIREVAWSDDCPLPESIKAYINWDEIVQKLVWKKVEDFIKIL